MNSLEYIDREIMFTQKEENIVKTQIESTPNDRELQIQKDALKIKLKVIKERLSHLQKIKAELGAWKVVQGTIVEGEDGDGHYCYIETVYFTGEKGEKVKKGLYNDETR